MTRHTWASNEQRDFLDARVAEFKESQKEKDTSTFFKNLFPIWRQEFPDREPTAEEVKSVKGHEDAVKKIETDTNKVCHSCNSIILTRRTYFGRSILKPGSTT